MKRDIVKGDYLNREILAIALPAIISNITTPLLGLIDTAIVGHLGSALLIGAIAVGASMFNMIYWIFGFLRVGSSGLTAQAYGRHDFHESSAQLWRSMALGLAIAILLLLLHRPLGCLMVWIISPDADVAREAVEYFNIVILGAPAVMCTYGLSGWMLGMQDSRSIMWTSLLTNVVNIAVSFTLVYGFGMRLAGVAAGTVSAQWAGFAFGLLIGIRKHHPQWLPIRDIFDISKLLEFGRINIDVFLRTLCLVAVTMWFTRAGARQSELVLAANAILMQLFLFYSYFTDGFAYAGEALAGKYSGAGDVKMLRRSVKRLAWWSTVLALVSALAYFAAGDWILSILTNQDGVKSVARDYFFWVVTVPLAGTTAFMYDGIFVGLTRTRPLLWSMAAAAIVFFAVYFLLYPEMHNHALWLAFCLYLLTRGLWLYLTYRKRYTDPC